MSGSIETHRVLVVEDEAAVARTIQQTLRHLGYQVGKAAATAEEALRLAAEQDPDLVLMDIKLGGTRDGIEAAAEIRARFGKPIVFLTAFADDATLLRSHAAEPHGYLVKPFKARELAATIETAIRKGNLEVRMLAAERQLSTVLCSIDDAVLATELTGTIVFANGAAEALIDTAGPLIGRSVDDCLLLRDEHGRMIRPFSEALAQGQRWSSDGHLVLERQQRGSRQVSVTIAPTLDDDGATGCVLVLRDVSARAAREQKIRQLQKMDALGRLSAGVAHDFNNLLTVIQGRAETTLMRADCNADVEADAEEILRASKRGAGLIRQLLAFGRRNQPFMQREDLSILVGGAHGMLRRLVGDHLELVLQSDSAPRPINADASLLDVMLMHLVVNARDAIPNGGTIILRLTTLDSTEALPTQEDAVDARIDPERCFSLEVVDDGEGMSPEQVARVFDPFYTTKKPGEGSGLGLSTAFSIVSEHGGRIDVESARGRGTTMRVLLPAARTEPRVAAATPRRTHSTSTREEVIAVVEDNEQVRIMLKQLLEMRGYRVHVFENGREALDTGDLLDSVDLLLSDQSMPGGVSGVELAETLRRRAPHVRVLLASGFASEAVARVTRRDDPFIEFLQKPFDAAELAERVRNLLDRSDG